jgi:hypothetical protein
MAELCVLGLDGPHNSGHRVEDAAGAASRRGTNDQILVIAADDFQKGHILLDWIIELHHVVAIELQYACPKRGSPWPGRVLHRHRKMLVEVLRRQLR